MSRRPIGVVDDSLWVDVGTNDTDDLGHGTHCCGTVGGNGTESDSEYKGIAPEATLTSYSAPLSLTLVTVVAAYDHMIERKQSGETDIQVVSNSYGLAEDEDYDPYDPGNVATCHSLEAAAVEDVHDDYNAESVGAGFADVYAAVERAEADDLADFGEATIAPGGE